MRYNGVMFSAFRDLFHRPDPPVPPVQPSRRLVAERQSEFFAWFHLEADGAPVPEDEGIRHRFRPLGEAFRALVVLDVVTDAGDGIRSAHLCLDRSFVSGPENAFARDIAKSFLGWILDDAAQEQAAPLIANIGNLAAANGPVITAERPAAAARGPDRRLCRLHRRRRCGGPGAGLHDAVARQHRRAADDRGDLPD